MAEFDKEELNKLPLRERIQKLKELDEKRKKESKEIDSMLKDSEKELKTEEVAEDVGPELEEVDISKLFQQDEEDLERTVREEAPTTAEISSDDELSYLSLQGAVNDYEELKGLSYASLEGGLSEDQIETVDKIGERLDQTKYMSSAKEVSNILDASRATLYKIKKYAGLDKENY